MDTKLKEKFLNYLNFQVSSKSISNDAYIKEIERCERVYGDDILKIRAYADIADLVLSITNERKGPDFGKPLNQRTRYKIISMLAVYYGFCEKYGYTEHMNNPLALGHSFKKGKAGEREFFDRNADKGLINLIVWHPELPLRAKVIIWTFFSAGLRLSELVHLNIEDVDLENRYFHIRAEISKTGDARNMPFCEDAQELFRYWIKTIDKQFGPLKPDSSFMPTIYGKRMGPSMISKILKKTGDDLNAKMNSHKWRHSLISWLVNFMDVSQVGRMVGHSDVSTTYGYTHIKPLSAKEKYDLATASVA